MKKNETYLDCYLKSQAATKNQMLGSARIYAMTAVKLAKNQEEHQKALILLNQISKLKAEVRHILH